jgi:cytochrome c biogenesis protein CcmG, thiol:disulfide interchange protein DsbE
MVCQEKFLDIRLNTFYTCQKMKNVFSKYANLIIVFTFFLGSGWIWFSRNPNSANDPVKIPAPQKGFLAPDFSLPDTNGEIITLSELRGQIVVLNIWASWCTPCRAEMPAMQRIFNEKKSQGLIVLAVNATNQDDQASAIDFANEIGLTFPFVFDKTGEISRKYQVRALPTSFFIDQAGVIQKVVIGGPMSEALLKIEIEKLLVKQKESKSP